jgi:hypothetical protein
MVFSDFNFPFEIDEPGYRGSAKNTLLASILTSYSNWLFF